MGQEEGGDGVDFRVERLQRRRAGRVVGAGDVTAGEEKAVESGTEGVVEVTAIGVGADFGGPDIVTMTWGGGSERRVTGQL